MKRIILLSLFAIFTTATFAQTVDLRRKIEVTGTAEQEVTPDIIYVTISLKEYLDGRNKVTIDQLEKQLQKAVTDAGIPHEDFTISNVSGYIAYQRKKNPDFLASKQYRIKFHDLNRYNDILGQVDPKGIEYTNIESYDYSKIAELKRDLKVKALLAARDKATYLLSAIGQSVGQPLEIQEIDNENFPQPVMRANVMMFKSAAPGSDQQSDIDVKTIKLNYQMHVVFEIK